MPEPLPTAKKIFDLEGEAQINADGKSRQEELRRCVPGESVELRREPDNQSDPNRITVLSARGVPIGRLTRQYAELLAPLIDQGRPHRAKLHCLRGGLPGYPNYGARISIAWDGRRELRHRPLDEAQERHRRHRNAPGASRRPAGADGELGPYLNGSVALRQADPDGRQLTIILLVLILAVVATYVAANIIASWCWACG
jgi:hypothetical protein